MTPVEKDLAEMNALFHSEGIHNFTASEVCGLRRTGRVVIPPREWWARMIPTLVLAEEIRFRLGEIPLSVGNGYRPKDYNKIVGGSRNSQHIHFRALDLDLAGKHRRNRDVQGDFYELACKLYLEKGAKYKIGLGLYRPWRGTRIHIDTGYRQRYWKKEYVKPILDGMK